MEKIMNTSTIRIDKNRGWRGLAQLQCFDSEGNKVNNLVFSFSQRMWCNMLIGIIVTEDENHYYVIGFSGTDKLPKPTQQRSVLIKNFVSDSVSFVHQYDKTSWTEQAREHKDVNFVYDFVRNRNNHTTSDWNYIGIRVTPTI